MRSQLPTATMTQPFVAIVCYTAAHVPTFAMSTFGIDAGDEPTVKVGGVSVPIMLNIDAVSISETRPEGFNRGLIRKDLQFNIKHDGPFATTPFIDKLYSAGATTDSFYFRVWVTDYSRSLHDILQTGVFFGAYKLDMGMGWDETSLITAMKLIEYPQAMYGRYGTTTEAAEDVLDGSEWQRLIEQPAYLGYRPKVPAVGRVDAAIGGYEAYNKAVKGVVAGIVQSTALSGTSIELGKSPTLASVVGQTLKVKFGNGCLVTGIITDLGGGTYGINTTGMVLNVAWDSVPITNVGKLGVGVALTTAFKPNSILLDGVSLDRIPSPTMLLKSPSTVEFYLAGVQTSAGPLWLKLTGIADETNKELTTEDFKDPDNPTWMRSAVNIHFNAAIQSANFTGDDAHFNYATWLASQSYSLYFSKNTYVLADIQKEGMPWEVIVTPHVNTIVTLPFVYYMRMIENTTIMEDINGNPSLFYNRGDTLVTVPAANIASIAYASTDFSMINMCKITLTARPSDVDIGYDNNFLFADTWPPMYAAEVISYILTAGAFPVDMFGATLSTTMHLGNTLGLDIKSETWTDLLDSVLFESGLQLASELGFYHLVLGVEKANVFTFNRGVSGETYQFVNTQARVLFGDVIDGTYKFNIGRTLTNIDAGGREFVRAHYDIKYKYASNSGEKFRSLRSTKAVKDNDRKIEITFKHIADTITCKAAAAQLTTAGHVANIGITTRQVEFSLPLSYVRLQAQDVVTLQDFRHLSALDSPLPAYNPAITNPTYTLGGNHVIARYTPGTPYMLVPGLYIIDNITYDFSGDGTPVNVVCKQVQPILTSNLKDVAESLVINDEADNAAAAAIGEDDAIPSPPDYLYYCPNGDLAAVTITPGEPVISATQVNDPCCNTSTTNATTYTDPIIVIYCTDDDNNPSIDWPHVCHGNATLYAETTDDEIGNALPVIYDVWANVFGNASVTAFTGMTYTGIGHVGVSCVQWVPGDGVDVPGSGVRLGKLYVYPCAFASPVDAYYKPVYLSFDISYCTTEAYSQRNDDDTFTMVYREVIKVISEVVTCPVSLKAVSDISIS